MTPDPPIACSLSADEFPIRLEQMRAVGRDSLLSVSRDGALRFRADDTTRGRLQDIIAAESRCCPFLAFDPREVDSELRLSITAPEGAKPLAMDLAHAFAGDAGPAR
jgi:hypothetical protein